MIDPWVVSPNGLRAMRALGIAGRSRLLQPDDAARVFM